ncbi:glycoside hydrolase family 3, partial [Pseudodesulfovibrio sp.]|nr:glycoside hydrolase family 3 [Pseudodesulfovibrio sp.]
MKRIFPIIATLFVLCLPLSALAVDLDTMIGQMLMAGFRGYTVDKNSPVVRDITEHHLGGVILFDYDVALGQPERN